MMTFLITGVFLAVLVAGVWLYIRSLDGQQKTAIKDSINGIFVRAERKGRFRRQPAFEMDYLRDYPALRQIEEKYEVIREECAALMEAREKLVPMASLGSYMAGETHTAQWTTLMFKSGEFIEDNCKLAPRTADILRKVPGLYTAFFSVIEPHQHIPAHYGYFKGFLRYHLGVKVPRNNVDQCCWIRVNASPSDNAADDKNLIDKGERYYWHDGEGVMFDDTFMHEAVNESDEVRVVLFLDVARRMPWHLDLFNRLILFIIHREGSVRGIREAARIRP
ncbi:MAG: aspartyl/asparaginyl beta-hydroxylase domain-containing protein [Myxococcota bacterium]